MDENVYETEQSLIKAKRVCKLIVFLMIATFVFLCCWWLASIVVMLGSLCTPELVKNVSTVSLADLAIFIVYGIVMIVICITLIKIFSDASKGWSPFTMLQVKRLRIVASALLIYSILEFAITCTSTFMQHGPIATINVASLVAAAVVFAFSFVFKYGVLLQEFSDESI